MEFFGLVWAAIDCDRGRERMRGIFFYSKINKSETEVFNYKSQKTQNMSNKKK